MRLLLTRPQPGAEHSADILRARGHEVLVAPLLRIEAIANADLGTPPWSGILISSANAARAIASHPRLRELLALPVLTVGKRTAEAARAAGFENVRSVDGDAGDLARAAASFADDSVQLLYLAGADRARDLNLGGRKLHAAVVYGAVKATEFPPSVIQALEAGRLDGVLHFSLRTAEAFLACARAAQLLEKALALRHFCLSSRVAAALQGAGRVSVAPRPDEASLLGLIENA